jgi:hypothetical protein
MTVDEARALCDRWLPLWTGNRPEALIECYADEAFYRDPARPAGVQGRAALLAYLRALLARFPAWTWEADEIFPCAGGFALRWRATIPVGGTVVRETGLDLVLVAGGRITRNEVYFDRAALLAAMREARP